MTPHSDKTEKAFLGAFIYDAQQVKPIAQKNQLTNSTFFSPFNMRVFDACMSLDTVDLVTVGESLNDIPKIHEKLEEIYDEGQPSTADYHAKALKELERKRSIVRLAQEACETCNDNDSDAGAITAQLTSSLVSMIEVKSDITTASMIAECEAAAGGNVQNIPLPYESLTRATGGLGKGMVTVLTGRSKSGKSMFKSYWMRKLGELNTPCLDLCFEDGIKIAKMRTASVEKFNASELIAGGRYMHVGEHWEWWPTNEQDIDTLKHQLAVVDSMPLYWHQKRMRPTDLLSTVSEYVNRYGVQLVFIDGAKDLLRPSGKYNDCGFEEEASQTIVDMAERLNIAVVAIHHLTKLDHGQLIHEGNIRGSGNIVSDSRSVYALQGDRYGAGLDKYQDAPVLQYDEDGNCTTRVLECLATNHGKAGKVWLGSDLGKCNFWKH